MENCKKKNTCLFKIKENDISALFDLILCFKFEVI